MQHKGFICCKSQIARAVAQGNIRLRAIIEAYLHVPNISRGGDEGQGFDGRPLAWRDGALAEGAIKLVRVSRLIVCLIRSATIQSQ